MITIDQPPVPWAGIALDVSLSVMLVAWIVKPPRVVDVEVVAVAWVGFVTGIEIQVPSPTAPAL